MVWLPQSVSLNGLTLDDFYRERLHQHTGDSYKGRTLAKMPEDLRVYEHVIWATQPTMIVELGTYAGGSALWFKDRLDTLVGFASCRVLTVDSDSRPTFGLESGIEFYSGDLADPATVAWVHRNAFGRVMVVDDSAHTYESTSAALRLYSDLVHPGCYFVVEDGIVDTPRSIWPGAGGVLRGINDFMALSEGWEQHFISPYGLTTDTGGWLYRREQ